MAVRPTKVRCKAGKLIMRELLCYPATTSDKGVDGCWTVHCRNSNRRVLFTDKAVVDVTAGILDIATMALPYRATRKETDPSREVIKSEGATESLYLELLLRLSPGCRI